MDLFLLRNTVTRKAPGWGRHGIPRMFQEYSLCAPSSANPTSGGRHRALGVRTSPRWSVPPGTGARADRPFFLVVGLSDAGRRLRVQVEALQQARSRTQEIEYYNGDVS